MLLKELTRYPFGGEYETAQELEWLAIPPPLSGLKPLD